MAAVQKRQDRDLSPVKRKQKVISDLHQGGLSAVLVTVCRLIELGRMDHLVETDICDNTIFATTLETKESLETVITF